MSDKRLLYRNIALWKWTRLTDETLNCEIGTGTMSSEEDSVENLSFSAKCKSISGFIRYKTNGHVIL